MHPDHTYSRLLSRFSCGVLLTALASGCAHVSVGRTVATDEFRMRPFPTEEVLVLSLEPEDVIPTECLQVASLDARRDRAVLSFTPYSSVVEALRAEAGKLGANTVALYPERFSFDWHFLRDEDERTEALALRCPREGPIQPHESCSQYPVYTVATFRDANLAEAVRLPLYFFGQTGVTCSQLASVRELKARGSEIVSLEGLHNLTNLITLDLRDNPALIDIQPLMDHPGFGPEGAVDLSATGADCADVARLEAKGADVKSGCDD